MTWDDMLKQLKLQYGKQMSDFDFYRQSLINRLKRAGIYGGTGIFAQPMKEAGDMLADMQRKYYDQLGIMEEAKKARLADEELQRQLEGKQREAQELQSQAQNMYMAEQQAGSRPQLAGQTIQYFLSRHPEIFGEGGVMGDWAKQITKQESMLPDYYNYQSKLYKNMYPQPSKKKKKGVI